MWIENAHYKFTTVCEASDDIDMFTTKPLDELIEFKWKAYG